MKRLYIHLLGAVLGLTGALAHPGRARAEEAGAPPRATIELVTSGAPTLQVSAGDQPAATAETCVPSCSIAVRAEAPTLHIVRGHEDPLVIRGLPARVADGDRFVLDYDSRNALRWLGGGTLLASYSGSAVLLLAGVLANPIRRCDSEGCYKDYGPVDAPMVIAGSALLVVGTLVGVILLTRDDRASVRPAR